jgi:hypothetical protein
VLKLSHLLLLHIVAQLRHYRDDRPYHWFSNDRLAILGDSNRKWRPRRFESELWGCSVKFVFPIVKLLDYKKDWAALDASRNPFAVVTMAHLKTKETHKNPEARKGWRYNLMTMLYDQGYSEQDIMELHHFLDWLMELPEALEREFQAELKAFEETKQMKYVTSIERMAETRGEARGEARGAKNRAEEIALNMLRDKLPLEQITRLTGLTLEEIQQLQAQMN